MSSLHNISNRILFNLNFKQMKLYISRFILGALFLFTQFISAQNLQKNQFKVKGTAKCAKHGLKEPQKSRS